MDTNIFTVEKTNLKFSIIDSNITPDKGWSDRGLLVDLKADDVADLVDVVSMERRLNGVVLYKNYNGSTNFTSPMKSFNSLLRNLGYTLYRYPAELKTIKDFDANKAIQTNKVKLITSPLVEVKEGDNHEVYTNDINSIVKTDVRPVIAEHSTERLEYVANNVPHILGGLLNSINRLDFVTDEYISERIDLSIEITHKLAKKIGL